MQKTDFIKAVANKSGMTQKDARIAVEAVLDVITEELRQGNKVTLTGFGTFEVRTRRERNGVNPQTKSPIVITGGKTPGFTASSNLKSAIRDSGVSEA